MESCAFRALLETVNSESTACGPSPWGGGGGGDGVLNRWFYQSGKHTIGII